MKEAKELKMTEKMQEFKNFDDITQRILAEQRKEIDKLAAHREIIITQTRRTEDEINQKKAQFEQWKTSEENKMREKQTAQNNDIIKREFRLTVAEEDMARREKEIQAREALSQQIFDEKNKISRTRIEIERLHSEAVKVREESDAIKLSAQKNNDDLAIREARLNDRESKLKAIECNLNRQEERIAELVKRNESVEKNIAEARKSLEPRINELKFLEKDLETREKALKNLEVEVSGMKSDNESILRGLNEKDKKLKEKERELLQKENDITRKALMAGIKE